MTLSFTSLAAAVITGAALLATPAQAAEVPTLPQGAPVGIETHVVSSETEPTGTTVVRLSDGAVLRDAPAGSVEAANKSCAAKEVCLWSGTNHTGRKFSYAAGSTCWNMFSPMVVRSLKTGSQRVLPAIWTKKNCKGTPSNSYRQGVSVPSMNHYAASVRF
ncbi:peptidase inhibitor family I36 protein [Nocardiopsis sp. DSM 44743]|uniref:Peptidase inhibitor family I36 protein n=1 Tax=Nocardiopsis lambiniae TaxID=3075539 RepID=A0ABU2M9G8_9ACTN|nr:peptidase inhibitor family I36 protein [Nocardiopsis sp. DSM 44743]